jgi:glycosyltransferase involved in cell wall biosynthesis
MRVVQVAPTAFGSEGLYGGGERYPVELARALARVDGIDSELVTFGRRPRVERGSEGLVVRVLAPWALGRGHPAHPLTPALIGVLAGADIVHTHHLRSAPSRIAAVAANVRGQRLVTTDHGLGGGGWWGALPRLFDRFLTVSRYAAATLRVPSEKVRIIYGGADVRRFAPDAVEPRHGILFVGRVTPHKGLDRLLRALPRSAALTIVGADARDRRAPESGYPSLIRRMAEGLDVRFASALGDDGLARCYRRAQVLAMPSVHVTCYEQRVAISELLGLVAIEAMASGTPVVASRIGGLPEVVRDGETGYLVEPGDIDGLRDRLATVLADARLARRLGDNACTLVRERFTWDACARRCVTAYEGLSR